MDEFSYLSVLLSIILGLAVTQILKGFRALLLSRARVRLYWPAIAWAFLLLVIYVQTWWASFGLRTHHDWTFTGFAIVLLQTALLYMMAGLVFPDFFGVDVVDLRENYFAHRGWFFGIAVTSALVSLAKDVVLSGHLPERSNVAFHVVFVILGVSCAVTAREVFHKAAIVFAYILFASYIALLFSHLS